MHISPLLQKIILSSEEKRNQNGLKEISRDCFLSVALYHLFLESSVEEDNEFEQAKNFIYKRVRIGSISRYISFAGTNSSSSEGDDPISFLEELEEHFIKHDSVTLLDAIQFIFEAPTEWMNTYLSYRKPFNEPKKNETPLEEVDNEEGKERVTTIFIQTQLERVKKFRRDHSLELDSSLHALNSAEEDLITILCLIESGEKVYHSSEKNNCTSKEFLNILFEEIEKAEKEHQAEKEDELDFLESLLADIKYEDDEKETQQKDIHPNKKFSQLIYKIKGISKKLKDSVYGQDHVVDSFVTGYFKAEVEAHAKKERTQPIATFLFVGPPGVGKTFLVEKASEILKLPYRRFDMSEYADKEAHMTFAGFDSAYKGSHAGLVTEFVKKNPHSLILFDEIEKANIHVKHLFLQILDAGRLKDAFLNEEISFKDCIIVFTTNAGRYLYEDPSVPNLSSLSRKVILNALSSDVDPISKEPSFPKAICSRFSSGNVLMFNHLGANHLIKITEKGIKESIQDFLDQTTFQVRYDRFLPYLILFSEGGKADARLMKGRSKTFIYEEFYELFNLLNSSKTNADLEKLKDISFTIDLPEDPAILSLLEKTNEEKILVFTEKEHQKTCKEKILSLDLCFADNLEQAKTIIQEENISMILLDIRCGTRNRKEVLNVEDIDSEGRDFLQYITEHLHIPYFMLEKEVDELSVEEVNSFIRSGAHGSIPLYIDGVAEILIEQSKFLHQQNSLQKLARANKVMTYQTAQKISLDGTSAQIILFDLRLQTAFDANDNENIANKASTQDIRFKDVIGAKDAKEELKYFIEYLKNPVRYVKSGLSAPKGILLYGPPGTGKTLLAKALAGESDVTFIHAEGNQFLKPLVGTGVQSVHDIFKVARKYAPSILFVDEIDAIAKERGSTMNDTSSDILTAFLTEMDGFVSNSDRPVFVLAATNFSIDPKDGRNLDPAILRRFDRRILVDLPNKEERIQFMKMKISKSKYLKLSDLEIENLAVRSTGMSLSNLDSVFEFALRNAFKTNDHIVNDNMIDEAFETYLSGEEKKWDPKELERTARHEAGHAFVCYYQGETPAYLTIVARDHHGGYMLHGDHENKGSYTKEELLQRIRVSLAGRASEIVYYGNEGGLTTGASGDLQNASYTIKHLLCTYGMDDEIGLLPLDVSQMETSSYYPIIRERMNQILKEEFEKTIKIIQENKDSIDLLVNALLEKNKLTGVEIEKVLKKEKVK